MSGDKHGPRGAPPRRSCPSSMPTTSRRHRDPRARSCVHGIRGHSTRHLPGACLKDASELSFHPMGSNARLSFPVRGVRGAARRRPPPAAGARSLGSACDGNRHWRTPSASAASLLRAFCAVCDGSRPRRAATCLQLKPRQNAHFMGSASAMMTCKGGRGPGCA